ncbi:MAG: XRE family transcriptional regulator [Pseudolabrys sp.]|jgi:HTH-type transcriptional regulator/antitoxin HigA
MMMDVRAIHNDADYEWALKEVEKYFDNAPASNTPEADRFDVLSALIEKYESDRFVIPNADPVEVLEFAMESMGKTQADLGHLITRSRATEVMKRKRRLSLSMVRIISEAWRIPAGALIGYYELDGGQETQEIGISARRQYA